MNDGLESAHNNRVSGSGFAHAMDVSGVDVKGASLPDFARIGGKNVPAGNF